MEVHSRYSLSLRRRAFSLSKSNMARPILPGTLPGSFPSQPSNTRTHQHPSIVGSTNAAYFGIQQGYSYVAPFHNISNATTDLQASHFPSGQPIQSPVVTHGFPNATTSQETTGLDIQTAPQNHMNHVAPVNAPRTVEVALHSIPTITNIPLTNPESNLRNATNNNRGVNVSSRGRGRGASRGRGSRPPRGRARNLLPSIFRNRTTNNNGCSSLSSVAATTPELLGFHETLRSGFQRQHEFMKSIRDMLIETQSGCVAQTGPRDLLVTEQNAATRSMTTLSNFVCSTFQIFLLSSFIGKAPLWYLFPTNEKENELFDLCATFFKSNVNGSPISLDAEQVTTQDFLNGDTLFGRKGVTVWTRRGAMDSSGTNKTVSSLRYRLRRIRSRLHDEITRVALQNFFMKVSDYTNLELGVKYSCVASTSREAAFQYCMKKQNTGADPLTDGSWKAAYVQAIGKVVDHSKQKLRRIYGKLESSVSPSQFNELLSYFKTYYSRRYGRALPLLMFEFRPRIPSILEAYIATKVRCRLADIATFVAKDRNILHQPFFEVSHCESHFIPIIGDLLNVTTKQGGLPLEMKFGYGTTCERISREELIWAKTQRDRYYPLSSEYISNSSNIGLNLLSSVIESSSERNGETQNDVQATVIEFQVQGGGSSFGTSQNPGS